MAGGKVTGVRTILDRLSSERGKFSTESAAGKVELLNLLSEAEIRSVPLLKKLHSLLCYFRAYPENREVYRAAGDLLGSFGERVRDLSPWARDLLADSAIEGTEVWYEFSYDVVSNLLRWYPKDLEIDWEAYEEPELLDPILLQGLVRSEVQVFDDGSMSTERWIEIAKGDSGESSLAWLFRFMRRYIPRRSLREKLYDRAEPPLIWRLTFPGAAPPVPDVVSRAPYFHRDGIFKFRRDPREVIAAPRSVPGPVDRRLGRALIRLTVTALAARRREVYADCRANPDEVYLIDLGRGARLVLTGVLPEHRLAIEGNYGYLLLKNGMPVGYGGVSPLFHQGNTGINIFEEYRGGESAYLFVQTLRAFRSLFGCRRFILNPYQAGAGNKEAVRSGAFWFYYKLGFRPAEPVIRKEAQREWKLIRADRSHRTSPEKLRRFGSCDLELVLPGAEERFEERWLGVLAAASTRMIAREGRRDRAGALSLLTKRAVRDLGARDFKGWSRREREAMEGFAPLLALIEDLSSWPKREKKRVLDLIRAKGGPVERVYVEALRGHVRFKRSLSAYARAHEEDVW